jgi:hypothetical protein
VETPAVSADYRLSTVARELSADWSADRELVVCVCDFGCYEGVEVEVFALDEGAGTSRGNATLSGLDEPVPVEPPCPSCRPGDKCQVLTLGDGSPGMPWLLQLQEAMDEFLQDQGAFMSDLLIAIFCFVPCHAAHTYELLLSVQD